jgi:hypothetical protein
VVDGRAASRAVPSECVRNRIESNPDVSEVKLADLPHTVANCVGLPVLSDGTIRVAGTSQWHLRRGEGRFMVPGRMRTGDIHTAADEGSSGPRILAR